MLESVKFHNCRFRSFLIDGNLFLYMWLYSVNEIKKKKNKVIHHKLSSYHGIRAWFISLFFLLHINQSYHKLEEDCNLNLLAIFPDMADAQEKVQKLISDLSSPYFLHSADHPRTPLVDVVLTHTNYGSWSRAVTMALCAKNKLCFIDNSLPNPTDPDIQPLWKRVSTMVLSWMLNSISNTITPSLASCRTPYELWCDLESRFTQGNNATIFKIQRELSNLQQGNLDITNYYNTFKTLWDQLDGIDPLPECTCGTAKKWHERVSKERVYQLLMGVKEPFFVLRSQILAMDPLPDLGKVHGLLISEEQTHIFQSINISQPTQEDSAMVSQKFQPQYNRPKSNNGQQRNSPTQRFSPQNQTRTSPLSGPSQHQQHHNLLLALIRLNRLCRNMPSSPTRQSDLGMTRTPFVLIATVRVITNRAVLNSLDIQIGSSIVSRIRQLAGPILQHNCRSWIPVPTQAQPRRPKHMLFMIIHLPF